MTWGGHTPPCAHHHATDDHHELCGLVKATAQCAYISCAELKETRVDMIRDKVLCPALWSHASSECDTELRQQAQTVGASREAQVLSAVLFRQAFTNAADF